MSQSRTKELAFFGHSDDTFGGGSTDPDEEEFYRDNFAQGTPIVFCVSTNDHAIFVIGHYSPTTSPCWSIGVQMADEGDFPPWRIWYEPEHDHSQKIMLEVPWDAVTDDVTDDVLPPK